MSQYRRNPPTGINVLIVGAGFAGLTAAIECHRKGHDVLVLESFPQLKILGDIISFGPNSGRIFQKWEGVEEQLDPLCHNTDRINFVTWDGDYLIAQHWDAEESYGKKFNGHRGEIHEIVFKHALARGIDIRLGQKVIDYFEDENEAGVLARNVATGVEERFTADVVFPADGVRSEGRKIVLGYEDKPISSGYAIYRSWFDSTNLKSPLTDHLWKNGDTHWGWIGPDVHFLAASLKNGKDFSWVCTHKDDTDIEESWSAPGKIEDCLKVVEGWDPVVQEIIKATPTDYLVDWKLIYRDPLPTWISPKRRIALIGDAAHPFLPTSIQGASQSMEDGATLAVCLEKCGGPANVREALRAYERIRYDRVLKAQKTGETTRDKWHKADMEYVKRNPAVVKLQRESWLLNFDSEKHAYEVYDDVATKLRQEDSKTGEGLGARL
ncbi:monoxygenase, putative [Talaromyces stipitatus ATCC 10500]|uniref:Monoxygenase, putative n=1 Tax=Talaromyces stipitatus (strain ATCC 10500 / CBS 375.48 / QM 6759 / NRRL 1006) TaxID=441959 RepID=B8MCI6_TALSN|nr:monooxygenase, putative [Talaromyces stipitatus ATCC 10500]EED18802.1 monoxygenase, putative [Talaromyces stipitatus ATCC 10500]